MPACPRYRLAKAEDVAGVEEAGRSEEATTVVPVEVAATQQLDTTARSITTVPRHGAHHVVVHGAEHDVAHGSQHVVTQGSQHTVAHGS